MNSRKLIIFTLFILFAGMTYADELHFKNGDHLTGKIKSLVDGKLVFESDVAGELTVEISKIRNFSSKTPLEVHLQDGTVLNQKVSSSDPNYFAIDTGEALQGQRFKLGAIASINPPPKPEPKWTGNLTAGITSSHGNTKTENVTASLNMSKRTEKDRTQLSADYARSKQEDPATGLEQTTEDWWKSKAKYDYFFTKKFFGYLDGRYEKDSIADLDRRVIAGAGVGYQWVESKNMNFSTEAGLASLYEKFDNQTESNSEISAQLGYHFDKQLTKTIKFINDTTYYPSLSKFSDYYLTTTAEIRASFTKTFFTNFKTIFDYDVTPAVGQGSTDVKYVWGIGWGF
jgi:putative salt-induced outer membrane protein YdiY